MTKKVFDTGHNEQWKLEAACRGLDTNMFYLEKGTSARSSIKAKNICIKCPVHKECINQHHDEDIGIFGGLSPKQRRKWRKLKSSEERELYQQMCFKDFLIYSRQERSGLH